MSQNKNFLIGIGGTGARVIEAVVFLCSIGYGPEELTIFLVDPDKGNGNFRRTKEIIDNYTYCRKNFQRLDSVELFKTDIKIPDPIVWNIFEDEREHQDTTLSGYINLIGLKDDKADLARILFSDMELNTPLNKGFRGHPSIGSVVMSNMVETNYPWKILFDAMTTAGQNDIRLFLVGSIFGGTGAAGVPTFGAKNVIKYHKEAVLGEGKSKVLLGGALVLPYFSFDSNVDTNEKMFVTPKDFPMATKTALEYYSTKKNELGFDQVYFIGDYVAQNVGKFSTGSDTQENLPHYIELITALAAYDFFEQPPIIDIPEKQCFVSGRSIETVTWDNLPFDRNASSSNDRAKKFKYNLVNMAVFAYTFCSYAYRDDKKGVLDTEDDKQPWFANNFPKEGRTDGNKQMLRKYYEFCKRFLFWLCASCNNSNIKMIDITKIANGGIDVGKEISLFDDNKAGGQHERYIGEIVNDVNSKKLQFSALMSKLNGINLKKETITPVSRIVNALYKSANQFCIDNFKFQP